MLPVIFSAGKISISSFGLFLFLGFLLAIFLVWRLSRAWDLDEEKILDLTWLTIIGGLSLARIYFVLENWQFFKESLYKIILLHKYPGFSFWGGLIGGALTLFFLVRRHFRMDFWQVADIGSVGLLAGIMVADVGCFLGGCSVGVPSKVFFAVPMAGLIGKRWPVQLLEALLLAVILIKIWSQATHFHQRGKIVGLTFTYLGFVKLLLEPLKQQKSLFFDLILFISGLTIFYQATGRNILDDVRFILKFAPSLFTESEARKSLFQYLDKTWYNQKASFSWKLRNLKKVLKKFNVKFSWKNS